MGPFKRESRLGFWHGCSIDETDKEVFHVLEERNSILVSGTAYPAGDSRSGAACGRALEIAADSFLGRPSSSEVAVEAIAGFINDEIYRMQEKDKAFLCNLVMLYIFKGKTRVYTAGDAAALFYENGELKNEWYGGGISLGSKAEPELIYSDEFELTEDSRLVLVAGHDRDETEKAIEAFRENNGEEPEDVAGFLKERRCSYVDLYLPRREKRGFFPGL